MAIGSRNRIGAIAALALACAGAPDASTPAPVTFDPERSSAVTKVYELVVQYPLPIWQSLPPTARHFNRSQAGRLFVLEQIPEDEEFPAAWTRIYAIFGLYAQNGRFESFKEASLREWTQACGEKHLALQTILDEPKHWQVLLVCESSPDGSAASGWGAEVGAVALMDHQSLSDTYVRVQHTWRGRRFDRADRSSWPVQEPDVREMVQRFARIQLSYNPDAPSVPHPGRDFEPN